MYLNKKLINDIIFILLCIWVERVIYLVSINVFGYREGKKFELN